MTSEKKPTAPESAVLDAVRRYLDAEKDLEGLMGGQFDAVLTPSGEPLLLRAAQEEIANGRALLRTVLDALPLGVAVTAKDGRLIRENAESVRIWGSFQAGVQRTPLLFESRTPVRPADWIVRKALHSGRASLYEELIVPDGAGGEAAVSISATPFFDESEAIQGVVLVSQDISNRKKSEEERKQLIGSLKERVKELRTLRAVAQVIQNHDADVDDMLRAAVEQIPSGWQHADLAEARIVYGGHVIATAGFVDTPWKQTAEFRTETASGRLEVTYLEEKPEADEGPFLTEERDMITSLAHMIQVELAKREAEGQRRATEDRYRRLIENSRELVAEIDLERGSVLFANPAHQAILGYHPSEICGRDGYQLIHPADESRLREESRSSEEAGSTDYRVRHKDGRWRWLRSSWRKVDHPKGPRAVMISSDITEQREAQEALRQTQEHLSNVLACSPVATYEAELRGDRVHVTWVTPNVQEVLGCSPSEVLQPDWLAKALHPEDREALIEANRSLRSLPRSTCDYRIRCQDGAYFWLRDQRRALSNGGAEDCCKVVGSWSDISAEKHREERLREQAALLELADDAIITRDMEGRVLFWNSGAEKLYGWTRAEAIGAFVRSLHLQNSSMVQEHFDRLSREGQWEGEMIHQDRNGASLTVFSRCTLLHDAQGTPKAVLAIDRDVTEKKKLEEQFLRAQRLEGIGALASGIAHDLNNILAPILMGASMLRETTAPAELERTARTLEASAQRGADIVQQVLSFARGRGGQRQTLPVSPLLRELIKMARETFPRNIRIRENHAPDLWPVLADSTQLHQVFLNLFVNARDAMPEGGELSIATQNARVSDEEAARITGARPGKYVRIDVRDTGCGMSPEVQAKIFEPFFTTKEADKGTGLGLSTTWGIVKSHGGFLQLETAPGAGASFHVYLPAQTRKRPDPANTQAANLRPGAGEVILVVDDEESVRSLAAALLTRAGYQPVLAEDGTEALIRFSERRHEIRAVVTDLLMPNVDGIALIRALRRLDSNVPIIVCSGMGSGMGDEARAAEAKRNGVNASISKPFSQEVLLETLWQEIHSSPRNEG